MHLNHCTHTHKKKISKRDFFSKFTESFLIQFNNFILRWFCTIAEASKNRPLITINMIKIHPVEADTKVISMWEPETVMSIPH